MEFEKTEVLIPDGEGMDVTMMELIAFRLRRMYFRNDPKFEIFSTFTYTELRVTYFESKVGKTFIRDLKKHIKICKKELKPYFEDFRGKDSHNVYSNTE